MIPMPYASCRTAFVTTILKNRPQWIPRARAGGALARGIAGGGRIDDQFRFVEAYFRQRNQQAIGDG
jgi:hypothetical protein